METHEHKMQSFADVTQKSIDESTLEQLRRENEELKAKLDKAKSALRSIASFGEGEFVTSSFDEPHAARRARTALEEIG